MTTTLCSTTKGESLRFQHPTQQRKQNLTNLNYVYGYFSKTFALLHLRATFSNYNQQKKIPGKIRCTRKSGIQIFTRKMSFMHLAHLLKCYSNSRQKIRKCHLQRVLLLIIYHHKDH